MKFFTPSHQVLIDALMQRIRSHYGQALVSLAVFGSYARGDQRWNSDLDLLIVLDTPSPMRRTKRTEDFVRNVEIPLDEIRAVSEKEGVLMEISPLILEKTEADRFLPIYLDMTGHHVLLVDEGDFLKKQLQRVRERMKEWGSVKRPLGNHWYWEIRPGTKWGEVIDYDE